MRRWILVFGVLVTSEAFAQEEYVDRALETHPQLGLIESRAKVAEVSADAMTRWPDPQVTLGYWPGMFRVEVMQMIPWPTKVLGPAEEARLRAQVERAQSDVFARELRRDVELLTLELWEIQERKKWLAELTQILEGVLSAVSARVEVGQAKASSLHQIGLQISKLRNEVQALGARENGVSARMAALLGDDYPKRYSAPDTLPAPRSVQDPRAYTAQLASHPELLKIAAQKAEIAQAQESAGAQGMPDFSVGYEYEHGPHTEMPHMVMVGFSIPIWRGTYRAAEDVATARRVAADAEERVFTQKASGMIYAKLVAINESAREIELYNSELVPQAEAAFESSVADFEQDGSVTALLLAQRDLVELKLKLIELKARHQSAWIELKEWAPELHQGNEP